MVKIWYMCVLLQTLNMSKETDHFETAENKDSEKKSLEDASEEMVRRRILTTAPIPHQGNTPKSKQDFSVIFLDLPSTYVTLYYYLLKSNLGLGQAKCFSHIPYICVPLS